MLAKLYLVRHGETDLHTQGIMAGWENDPGLNAEGQRQAQATAQQLADQSRQTRIGAIYASPLPRARQTAEIINAVLKVPLVLEDDLRDINIGDWNGQSVKQVFQSEIGRQYMEDPVGVRLPDGEEITEVEARVIPVVERIRRAPHEAAVIVSHLDVIQVILTHYKGGSLHDLHRGPDIPTGGWQTLEM